MHLKAAPRICQIFWPEKISDSSGFSVLCSLLFKIAGLGVESIHFSKFFAVVFSPTFSTGGRF